MAFTGETVLYPLAVGNKWTYKMTTGGNYSNSVVGIPAIGMPFNCSIAETSP